MKGLLLLASMLVAINSHAFCINNTLAFEVRWIWHDAPALSKDGGRLKPGEYYCRPDNDRDAEHARIIMFIPHGARDIFRFGRDLEYICAGTVINPKTADINIVYDGLSYFCEISAHQPQIVNAEEDEGPTP